MRTIPPTVFLAVVAMLTACGGGETSRHLATITDVCSASGENPAVCSCVADSLQATVGDEGVAAMAGYLRAVETAEDDATRRELMMSVAANPTLMQALEQSGVLSVSCERIAASSPVEAGGGQLAGVYLPQLGDVPASERRLAAATADRRWEFTADGKVTTYSQAGARRWSYRVRGKEIQLTGSAPETQGERRRFTFHADGRCIWDGSGNSSVDMRFCPG